jgi:hypothetical protein
MIHAGELAHRFGRCPLDHLQTGVGNRRRAAGEDAVDLFVGVVRLAVRRSAAAHPGQRATVVSWPARKIVSASVTRRPPCSSSCARSSIDSRSPDHLGTPALCDEP